MVTSKTISEYIEELKKGNKIKIKYSTQQTDYTGTSWYSETYSYDEKIKDKYRRFVIHYIEPNFDTKHNKKEIVSILDEVLSEKDGKFEIEILSSKEDKNKKVTMEEGIDNSPRVDINLKDGSILKNVHIYKEKRLYDSIVADTVDIIEVLDGDNDIKTIYYSSEHLQGGLCHYSEIKSWDFVEEE